MKSYRKYFFSCFNYILISSLSIAASCQQIQKKRNDNGIDTIKRDIPANKQTPKFRLIKENIENKIGINSLENGIEGMEIPLHSLLPSFPQFRFIHWLFYCFHCMVFTLTHKAIRKNIHTA